MKKNNNGIKTGILRGLILIILAAASFGLAWYLSHPDAGLPLPDGDGKGSIASSDTELKSETVGLPGRTDTESEEISVSTQTDGVPTTDTDVPATDSNTESEPTSTETEVVTPSVSTEQNVEGYVPPPVDNSPKRIAFTFDDGPAYNGATLAIAEEFAKYGGHCTYFVVGNRVYGKYAEVVGQVSAMGNEVGIHAYTHTKYYNECSDADYQYEVGTTAQVITNVTGKAPTLMRPVGGNITKDRIAQSPYSVIMWNVDTKDWKYSKSSQANVDTIVQNILSSVSDGDVVLMHDIYGNTMEAVKIALPILKEQGYEFVTVSELFGGALEAGKRYSNAY